MKKKTIVLLIALSAYCYLFYKQSAGINFTIFNALLVICLLVLDRTLVRSRLWLVTAAGALLTSVGVLLYGNFLSCFANVISLVLLAHLSLDKTSTLVFSLLQSSWSFITMPFLTVEKLLDQKTKDETDPETTSKKETGGWLKFAIPVVLLVVFFFIYRASNAVFDQFVSELSIEISWHFVWFLIIGLLLMYGFFYQKSFSLLTNADRNGSNLLSVGIREKEFSLFSSLDSEFTAVIMTFGLLNVLLLLVNILDLNFILSGKEESLEDFSNYVHEGVNSSIFSVIIAIFVTLYFFRGNLNFIAKNKQVKYMALIWIVLNIVLLGTCLHKNMSYIHEFGLTHKRIGVYFYLFLTFIAVITTWIKIMGMKSNWFLLRTNIFLMYVVLVFSTMFNWNKLILDYNSQHKLSIEREYYLYQLGDASLPFLIENYKNLPTDYSYARSTVDFEGKLSAKIQHFMYKREKFGWQSWNMENERIYQLLVKQNNNRPVPKLVQPGQINLF